MMSLWYLLLTSLITPPINKNGHNRIKGYHAGKNEKNQGIRKQWWTLYTNTDNINNLNWPVNSSLISRAPNTDSILRLSDEESSSLFSQNTEINNDIYNTVTIEEFKCSSTSNNELPIISTASRIEEFLCLEGKGNEQFIAKNVQEILIRKGSEINSAREAGESVQAKAYERFLSLKTRRRGKTVMNDDSDDGDCSKYYDVESVIDVLTEAGLSGRDCAAILCHTPSIALMKPRRDDERSNDLNTVEDIINCILKDVLSGLLSLRKYDARKVLRGCPGLLTKKGTKDALGCLKIFSSLGVSYNSLARDKTTLPFLLSRSPTLLFNFITFLSSNNIRMSLDNIGPLLRRAETLPLLDAVCPTTYKNVKSQDSIKSNYANMKLAVDALTYHIGLESVQKVIASYPCVLLFNPNTQIIPVAEYLSKSIGLYDEEVARVIESYPLLLSADVADIQNVIDYLIDLDVSNDNIAKIFRAFPGLFLLDVVNNIVPVVDYLRSIGIENIGRFITRLPPVLGYSVERELMPKWKYLTSVCEFHEFEIQRFPAYFSYPLDKVIMTRYDYLKHKGIPYKAMSVDTILRFGDVDFATSVAGDQDDGCDFSQFKNARRRLMNNHHMKEAHNSVTTAKNGNRFNKL